MMKCTFDMYILTIYDILIIISLFNASRYSAAILCSILVVIKLEAESFFSIHLITNFKQILFPKY